MNNSYWGNNGNHQALYESMKDRVPDSGESDDPAVELLRCGTNIYYDCYNNGGCNLDVRSDQLDTILAHGDQIVAKIGFQEWQNFQNKIVAHRDQLEDPDGYEDETDCVDCGGSGYEDCSSCDGSGEHTCLDCDGSGENPDEEEGGDCLSCDGSGEVECNNCEGTGEEECSTCGGDGVETEWIEEGHSYLDDSVGDESWQEPLEHVMDAIILIVAEKLGTQPAA